MPTPKRHALTILGAVDEARSELVGKAVVSSSQTPSTVPAFPSIRACLDDQTRAGFSRGAVRWT